MVVVTKNRMSQNLFRLYMYLFLKSFVLLKPASPVSLGHCYRLQSHSECFNSGVANERAHQNGLLSLFKTPQMVWWCDGVSSHCYWTPHTFHSWQPEWATPEERFCQGETSKFFYLFLLDNCEVCVTQKWDKALCFLCLDCFSRAPRHLQSHCRLFLSSNQIRVFSVSVCLWYLRQYNLEGLCLVSVCSLWRLTQKRIWKFYYSMYVSVWDLRRSKSRVFYKRSFNSQSVKPCITKYKWILKINFSSFFSFLPCVIWIAFIYYRYDNWTQSNSEPSF